MILWIELEAHYLAFFCLDKLGVECELVVAAYRDVVCGLTICVSFGVFVRPSAGGLWSWCNS